jgi:hypothetical protein
LIIKNQKKEAGRHYDSIYLKTNSKMRFEIRVGVCGDILDIHQKGEKQN